MLYKKSTQLRGFLSAHQGNVALKQTLHVKQEVHHVAVFDDVVFTF